MASEPIADTNFAVIEGEIQPFLIGTRTLSAAQLAWFLQNVWRLEPEEIENVICDGGGDKGIDALWVDEDLKEIVVFQSKHRETDRATQGDADLKALVGAAAYFESPATVQGLLDSRPNEELTNLLARQEIAARISDGVHVTRLVFLTNGPLDAAGSDYIATVAALRPSLEVWDRDELASVARRTQRPALRPDTVEINSTGPVILERLDDETSIAIAIVPAEQLVELPGIADLSLFDRNVRVSLRRTRINEDVGNTVANPAEHARFPAFHNGMTILTSQLEVDGSRLTLHGLGVVNGCQSLLALSAGRANLTPELRVLVKVVQVDPSSDVADAITYRTNNQNPVDIRDQRSTDAIQRDLRTQVEETYGADFEYVIRAGEVATAASWMDNRSAAQLLVAVFLKEPWNAVRKLRLFDEEYHRVFNRQVDAPRLRFLSDLSAVVDAAKSSLRPELQASFATIRLTIAYLVSQVLAETAEGRGVMSDPSSWFMPARAETLAALRAIVHDVVESINFYIENEIREKHEAGLPYDPKVVFKSAGGVRSLEQDVLRSARRQALRAPDSLFTVARPT